MTAARAAFLTALLVAGCGPSTDTEEAGTAALEAGAAGGEARLYFPGNDDRLHIETRQIADSSRPPVELAIEALLAGPESPGLHPILPADVSLARLHRRGDVIYLDLASSELPEPPPMGSRRELLTVWALVHTALDAAPASTAVVLLWNGEQREAFAEHVDTTRPLGRRSEFEAG